jgi:hypothetical protein
MRTGRPPLNLTSRTCKRCGLVCPIEMFRIPPCRTRPNGSIRNLCAHCNRLYGREHKAKSYADPAKRQRILDRNRGYRTNKMSDAIEKHREHRSSKHMWIKIKCEAIELLTHDAIIVYLGPVNTASHIKPQEDRPWRARTWAIRSIRPGMVPPPHSMPLFRFEHGMATAHPLCTEEWRWVARMVQQWINRNKEATDGE